MGGWWGGGGCEESLFIQAVAHSNITTSIVKQENAHLQLKKNICRSMTSVLGFFYYRLGLLTIHGGHIPDNKLFVKLGGDHGQKSMKFAFQLANLEKPNSSKKTVVFCIFEATDSRNSLCTAVEKYQE